MTIFVHYIDPPQDLLEAFRNDLHPVITLTTGGENDPIPPQTTILVHGTPTAEQLAAAPNLKAVIIPWAGLPSRVRRILPDFPQLTVHNLHHNAVPTAELGLALLLAAAKFIVPFDRALRQLDWTPRYQRPSPSMLLHGKTALILGYGAIGQQMAHYCHALGMNVLAVKRTPPDTQPPHTSLYPVSDLPALLPQANVLIITLPGTPETNGLIGEAELSLMPEGAILVNIGRGRVVNDGALYEALTNGKLRAAGIDVWYNYPTDEASRTNTQPADAPLHTLDNVVLSPHRGGMTEDTHALRLDALAQMLNEAATGRPLPNQIDLERGY